MTQSVQSNNPVPVVDPALDPKVALLRTWQAARLTHTYADLLTSKRYRPACLFFLSDIYAPRDFSNRDREMERIYAALEHRAPKHATDLFRDLMELNRVSYALDEELIAVLFGQLGVTESISEAQYADAYRLCNNYPARAHQIDVIVDVITRVGDLAKLPMIGMALKMLHPVAHQMGWGELHDFAERGHDAFRQMGNVAPFVEVVRTRETQILKQIYAACADPFNVSDTPCPDALRLGEA